MKILVIETAFLGDVIVSLGLAEELRVLEPSATVYYLTRPDAESIVAACPAVDHALTFDKRGAESGRSGIETKAALLNDIGFDIVYLLHSSRRSQELCRQLRAPKKVGFNGMTHAGLTDAVEDSGWNSRYERALLPLRTQYPIVSTERLPQIAGEVPASVGSFVAQFTVTVALAPGSVWATKRWGIDRYATLARLCVEQGYGVIIVGGSSEETAACTIAAACPLATVLSLCGTASIIESAGALTLCSLLVTNDSAPAHLATAVGTPSLTIFGPTVPEFGFVPSGGKSHVIEYKDLWCRPCTSHGSQSCPIYTHRCMNAISAESVFQRVLAMSKL